MNRREFLKAAAIGIAAVSVNSLGCSTKGQRLVALQARPGEISLTFSEAMVEMVDATPVYHWVFEDAAGPHFPGPVITARTGEPVTIWLSNNLPEEHGFSIHGVIDSGPIPPGQSVPLRFNAPAAGSYLYFDPLNAPVNRVLGLHGPMVVLPSHATNNPYSAPTPAALNLFNDLGNASNFPGEPWEPERSRIWLFSQIDPKLNQAVMNGQQIDSTSFVETFLPRYFTLNGESGGYASHNHDTVPSGRIGQPHLIRMMNAGLSAHSPHIHGNHVYVTAINNKVQDNLIFIDTFTVAAAETVDWLLPFHRPPDIPGDPALPLRALIPNELATVLGDEAQSPLKFPMHCHAEMSQTAAGGNYPQGLVTHWEITGDLDGVDFPEPKIER